MPGPVIRIVRLVFDKRAAARTEREAKESLSKTDRVVKRLKSTFIKLGLAISGAFVVQKMVAWGRAALQAGVAAEETFSKFNTVFGESAKTLDAFLDDWIRLAGATEAAGRNMAATFGAIGQGFGLSTPEAAAFSVQLIKLAGDLQSFHDVPIQETFEALRSGLTESEPLKRFGILILDVDVKQRALLDTGKKLATQLTRQEILIARVNLIQERAGVAVGDLDRTSGSTANTIRRLGGAWDRLSESIGVAVVANNDARGVMNQLIDTLEESKVWVDANGDSFKSLGIFLGTVVEVLGLVLSGWVRLGNFVTSGWAAVVGFVVEGIADMVDGFAAMAEAVGRVQRFFGLASGAAFTGAENLRQKALDLRRTATDLFDTMERLREQATRQEAGPVQAPAEAGGGPAPVVTPPTVETGPTKAEIKERNRLLKEAQQIIEDGLTPLEVYNRQIRILGEHFAAGRIDIDQYARAVAQAEEALASATEETDRLADALAAHQEFLSTNSTLAAVLGDDYNALEQEASALRSVLRVMADEGIGPLDERFAGLVDRLNEVRDAMDADAEATKRVGEASLLAGELLGAAFGGGIGRLAASKAKQNALLAAEHIAQAFASLLNPLTAAAAGGHVAAAGKFAAIAAGWQALSTSAGGGGGGAVTGAAGAPGVSRDLGGRQSGQFDPTATEVHIHLVGEGFDAVNPRVQRVVAGATQMVQERFGENARVRIHRGSSG